MNEIYEKLGPGHLFQKKITGPGPKYDVNYSSYYNTVPSDTLSEIRLEYVMSASGAYNKIERICDVGYGNGSFLKTGKLFGYDMYGCDISDYPVPEGTTKIHSMYDQEFDLVTFFDSLEHFQQHTLNIVLSMLNTKYVCVSLPWWHESRGEEHFMNEWKHRKENEHIHHFDAHGLIELMIDSGYKVLKVGNPEDIIRKPVDSYPNILTVVAKKL